MTLRQQIPIHLLIFKKALQVRRPLSETKNEVKTLYQSIGALTITWAQVETVLDYLNGILIMHRDHPERELPRTLKPKIGFFKTSFDRIPGLAPFRERANKIASELNRLKTVRHDAVHGVALERMPVGTFKATRLGIKGKDISQQHTTYQLADIAFAAKDALAPLQELNSFYKDVFCALYHDQSKQVYAEISAPTTATAAPPSATSLSRSGESDLATHQGHRLRAHPIHFSVNGFAGFLIGAVSVSRFEVLVSSMCRGVVTSFFVALITGRSSCAGAQPFFRLAEIDPFHCLVVN